MSKTARNAIIAAAVVVVVAVAAVPFIMKGLKNQNAEPVDASISSTAADIFGNTDPIEAETTADVIAQIMETMDNQAQAADPAAQAQAPATQAQTPATQAQTPATQAQAPATQAQAPATQAQTQATAAQQQAGTTTTKSSIFSKKTTTQAAATTTKAAAKVTTTKAAAKTTTKKSSKTTTTKASSSSSSAKADGPMTAVTGAEAMSTGGVVSYLWNPDGNFYYVDDNPWQRNFGFNVIYDWSAAMLVMYYDTWRACFDYDNLEWMIQAWKGQYGFLFIGGEIGVYTRTPGQAQVTSTHYDCADDNHLINMEMSIYYDAHDGNGYKLMFTRSYYPHWWSTGFVDGHLAEYKFNDRSCIIMMTRMTMYDADMTTAFTNALAGCGFRRVDSRASVSTASSDTFTTVGNDVYFSWKSIDQDAERVGG